LAVAALAFQFQDFLRRYFFTRGHGAAAFTNDAVRYLGQIAVLIGLFMSFPDAMDTARVLWVIAITAAIAAACGAFFIERIEVSAATLLATASRHWHFSKWLTGAALMQSITGNLFIITAGALLGASAVGALKAAQNLMGALHILFQGLENIVPIRGARLFHEAGRTVLSAYLKRVTLTGAAATSVTALILAIAPEFWLNLVFGTQYSGYGFLLQWYAFIYLLIFIGIPLRSGLRACEQTKTIFRSYVWMTLFSLLATYPAVKLMALNGVMVGILIVNSIHVVTLMLGFSKLKTIKATG
jgi:O-antigen/teichoic acid export membrane protein